MEYSIKKTVGFLNDYKKLSFLYRDDLRQVIEILTESGTLPEGYNSHLLKRDFFGVYDSHLDDDIVLLWKKRGKTITLIRIGTHEDIF